jgi:hypothetical protein
MRIADLQLRGADCKTAAANANFVVHIRRCQRAKAKEKWRLILNLMHAALFQFFLLALCVVSIFDANNSTIVFDVFL